jgi:predicted NACHT family NTPase
MSNIINVRSSWSDKNSWNQKLEPLHVNKVASLSLKTNFRGSPNFLLHVLRNEHQSLQEKIKKKELKFTADTESNFLPMNSCKETCLERCSLATAVVLL